MDSIVSGQESGHYFLLIGPKGVGKSTMLIEAMKKIQAEVGPFEKGVDMC